ncbi:hypothetical protein Q8A67_000164 [Cirrhinus molitorella]|uniref:Septin-type G domain-containing protein n=1 Tax=Cirrhinus molitorella TaxID=172907 RepID=A0AA88TZY1_9TELE|nr:hypothetical protein Q8A67_000164 [Cirrhinus molitorella]
MVLFRTKRQCAENRLWGLRQGGHLLEGYVEEFVKHSHLPSVPPHKPSLIHRGPPKRFRLHTERRVLDDNGKVRKWSFGRKDTRKPNKIVLLVGETGAGKTTLINSMVNYLLGVEFENEIWYEITEEEAKDQSESQTSEITVYEVFPVKSPISLTIIDTPGYGDTRGLDKDLEVAENLATLFQSKDEAEARQTEKRYIRAQRDAWDDSVDGIKHFFQSLDEMNRRSLELTSKVLKERIQFEASICNLQLQVQEKELKKAEKLQIQEAIRQNQEQINRCKNFSFQIKMVVKEKVPIESAVWKHRKATTCTVCEENCHEFDCWWGLTPSFCEIMKNDFCTVCRGKCHHSKHVKENKKYVIRRTTKMLEFNSIKKDYEKAQEESRKSLDIIENLDNDLRKIEDQKSILLSKAYQTIKHLSQIALKPDSAFTLQHLDFFIPRLREAGKVDWVCELEEMRRKAVAEEANKDALSYLKAGIAKMNLLFSGQ